MFGCRVQCTLTGMDECGVNAGVAGREKNARNSLTRPYVTLSCSARSRLRTERTQQEGRKVRLGVVAVPPLIAAAAHLLDAGDGGRRALALIRPVAAAFAGTVAASSCATGFRASCRSFVVRRRP